MAVAITAHCALYVLIRHMEHLFSSPQLLHVLQQMLRHEDIPYYYYGNLDDEEPYSWISWDAWRHYGNCGQSCGCCRHLNPEDGPCCDACDDLKVLYILKMNCDKSERRRLYCTECNSLNSGWSAWGHFYCRRCWVLWEWTSSY